jgi:hypothetical protein
MVAKKFLTANPYVPSKLIHFTYEPSKITTSLPCHQFKYIVIGNNNIWLSELIYGHMSVHLEGI